MGIPVSGQEAEHVHPLHAEEGDARDAGIGVTEVSVQVRSGRSQRITHAVRFTPDAASKT